MKYCLRVFYIALNKLGTPCPEPVAGSVLRYTRHGIEFREFVPGVI